MQTLPKPQIFPSQILSRGHPFCKKPSRVCTFSIHAVFITSSIGQSRLCFRPCVLGLVFVLIEMVFTHRECAILFTLACNASWLVCFVVLLAIDICGGTLTGVQQGIIEETETWRQATDGCQCNLTISSPLEDQPNGFNFQLSSMFYMDPPTEASDGLMSCAPMLVIHSFNTSLNFGVCPSQDAVQQNIWLPQGHILGISLINTETVAESTDNTLHILLDFEGKFSQWSPEKDVSATFWWDCA